MTTETARRGDWLQTFTGRQFWPLDPDVEQIDIADIAHALSMQCRFGGHCLRFYSVAEHSVHVARFLARFGEDPETQLWGLLHDAAEAYVVDLPRPLKRSLPEYERTEARLLRAIAARFGLPRGYVPSRVKHVDHAILSDEALQNMSEPPQPWVGLLPPLGIELQFWSPEVAEQTFLTEYWRLQEARAAARTQELARA